MHKILQNHLLCAFVANLKIGANYALYPESFRDKNLAIRRVFAFCDSAVLAMFLNGSSVLEKQLYVPFVDKNLITSMYIVYVKSSFISLHNQSDKGVKF